MNGLRYIKRVTAMNDDVEEPAIGGRQLRRPSATNSHVSIMLVGKAGCGKTTLASTAPGTKLFMLFDSKGTDSIVGRDDILELPLANEGSALMGEFDRADPFGLSQWCKRYPDIETIVVDSVTEMANIALDRAVTVSKGATALLPGKNGWSARNAILKRAISMMIRISERLQKHLVIIAHEGNPLVDDSGAVIEIATIFSPNLATPIIMQLGEVWWLHDSTGGKDRKIAIRPTGLRKYMKTRMWDTSGVTEFSWKYNVNEMKGDGISTWFDQWKANGGRKLALPK